MDSRFFDCYSIYIATYITTITTYVVTLYYFPFMT